MEHFPIFCHLQGKRCLIVGGGQVATHKARGLLSAGATLRIVAPSLTPELEALRSQYEITWQAEPFSPRHLQGCWLVVAATSDPEVNRRVSEAASAEYLFCNIVNDPSRASFITPAIIDRSPVIIALSCGGNAPVYSKILKEHVIQHLPADMRDSVLLAGALRARVNHASDSRERKRAFWVAFFHHAPLLHALRQKNGAEVQRQVDWLFEHVLLSL